MVNMVLTSGANIAHISGLLPLGSVLVSVDEATGHCGKF